jgi:hypothetical protein
LVTDQSFAGGSLQGAGCHGHHHAQANANERHARLPELEAMVVLENQWEGAEEEVQDREKEGGVETKVQAHGFVDEQEEWPVAGMDDGLERKLPLFFELSLLT